MIRVSAKVTGAADLARRFLDAARPSGHVMLALEESATVVQAEAQRLIHDGPKSGRIYKKYQPKRIHQASAPGEPPATDLGHLAANIIVDRAELGESRITIASLAKYSAALEFGTSKIKPRPFMRAAIRNSRAAVARIFRAAMRRRFR